VRLLKPEQDPLAVDYLGLMKIFLKLGVFVDGMKENGENQSLRMTAPVTVINCMLSMI
jgi:hypothetical protein